jgi:hypothetical protein
VYLCDGKAKNSRTHRDGLLDCGPSAPGNPRLSWSGIGRVREELVTDLRAAQFD